MLLSHIAPELAADCAATERRELLEAHLGPQRVVASEGTFFSRQQNLEAMRKGLMGSSLEGLEGGFMVQTLSAPELWQQVATSEHRLAVHSSISQSSSYLSLVYTALLLGCVLSRSLELTAEIVVYRSGGESYFRTTPVCLGTGSGLPQLNPCSSPAAAAYFDSPPIQACSNVSWIASHSTVQFGVGDCEWAPWLAGLCSNDVANCSTSLVLIPQSLSLPIGVPVEIAPLSPLSSLSSVFFFPVPFFSHCSRSLYPFLQFSLH